MSMDNDNNTDGMREAVAFNSEICHLRAGYAAARLEIASLKAQLESVGAGGVTALMGAAGDAGWQPIETAPKDGTEILLGRAEGEGPAISTPGHWREGFEDGVDYIGCDSGFVDSEYQVFDGGRSFGTEKYRCAPSQPTHWMPLPLPPSSAKGAGHG